MSKRIHMLLERVKVDNQVVQRVAELRRLIEEADYRYFVLDNPTISDDAYDSLYHELTKLEEKYPELVTPDSPTQRVGSIASEKFPKYRHVRPILSFDKVHDEEELHAFDARVRKFTGKTQIAYVCELKIDGLAISLRYEEGSFVAGATRGDSVFGEDVTANVRTIKAVPMRLRGEESEIPRIIEVRGEAYIRNSDFEKVNVKCERNGLSTFVNARNLVSGTIRQLDPRVVAERSLSFFAYAVGELDVVHRPATQFELLNMLHELGFPTNKHIERMTDIAGVQAFVEHWERKRDDLDYEIDGVVVKIDDLALQEELGFISKYPRWAIAYKFRARQARTGLREIGINVSRSGKLNPYAVLDPVPIGGVTVERATLHNEEDIHRKDIRVGDTVVVRRAGDVIPYVVGPVLALRPKGTHPFAMLERCPACGSEIERPEDDAFSYCTNISCPAQVRERVRHYATRGAMDIEGIGDALANALVDHGLVGTIADLYDLTVAKLADVPRMGEKSASNVLKQIEASKKRGLVRVLSGLNIRYVGAQNAALLAGAFGSIEAIEAATTEELMGVEGIGPQIAESIRFFFAQPQNCAVVERLRVHGVVMTAPKRERAPLGALAGKRLVPTGTLPTLTREKVSELITQAGGKVGNAVSKKTDYVIAGEEAGSKLVKARELGITILDEAGLLALIERK